jgi:ribosomal protein S18 acetylase RimI-like enzyme
MIEGYGLPTGRSTVRPATVHDAAAVAALHASTIREGFLSGLGERFLRRLYARIAQSDHAFLLVADPGQGTQGDGLCGFVAGSSATRRLYREFLLKDGFAVVASSGLRLTASLPRAIETLRYGTSPEGDRAATEPLETELLALAVAPEARRRGTGAMLVAAFFAMAGTKGSATVRVVVGENNDGAIALYRRAGFTEATPMELHKGTVSLLMRVNLSQLGT